MANIFDYDIDTFINIVESKFVIWHKMVKDYRDRIKTRGHGLNLCSVEIQILKTVMKNARRNTVSELHISKRHSTFWGI